MKWWIIAGLALTYNVSAYAQTSGHTTIQNSAFWGGYELYLPLHDIPAGSGGWGLFAEGYIKRANFFENPMGWFWRLGGTYYLKNENRISGGLAYQFNIPYDTGTLPYSWPDWRIWEQFMLRKTGHRNKDHLWVHRIRFEERFLGRKNDPDDKGYDYYKFETTFRYMIRSQWYVTPRFGMALYDELHLRLISSVPHEFIVDQNRIYAGIIWALNGRREWRLETGYMFQAVWNAEDEPPLRDRINHTWRVTLTADAPLKHRLK